MIKILFIFHNTGMGGGANLSGLTLIRGLKEMGHQVMAVCNAEGEMASLLRSEGFDTVVAPYHVAWPSAPHSAREWARYIPKAIRNRIDNRRAAAIIAHRAAAFAPDVVHTNSSVIDVGSMVSRRLNLPHVTHFREYGLRDANCVMWHLRHMLASPLNYNIAIARDIADFHHLDLSDRSRLIYNGIVDSDLCRMNPEPGKYFLYVGQLNRAKGIEDLLQSYALLPSETRTRIPLLIAGRPSREEYLPVLQDMISSLGIAADVQLLGHRTDVADLMYGAMALVVPSHSEAFGRIIPEAMANGCLVTGRDAAGIREQFDNGLHLTGHEIALRFNDVAGLTEILRRVASDPLTPALTDMRRQAMHAVDRLYSRQAYVQGVISLYQDIIRNEHTLSSHNHSRI